MWLLTCFVWFKINLNGEFLSFRTSSKIPNHIGKCVNWFVIWCESKMDQPQSFMIIDMWF